MQRERNILICCTGSVATIKLETLVQKFLDPHLPFKFNIKVVTTERAKHFFHISAIPDDVSILSDNDEWQQWRKRGDPILHIDLGKWADVLLLAPLSANTLGKISSGICDNLLTCIVRAWDIEKLLFFCPAMNTRMYDHPVTSEQIEKLKSWGHIEIPCISKKLMCGDTGNGAMAEVETIVATVINKLEDKSN